MKTINFIINNDHGMHARPAGQFVNVASEFMSLITVNKDGKTASAKGLFALMGLGIKPGEKVRVEIEGDDEESAYDAVYKFLNDNFSGEELVKSKIQSNKENTNEKSGSFLKDSFSNT